MSQTGANGVAHVPSTSLKILLAADNEVNQTLAIRLLEKVGHEVVVANNGEEAVELFSKRAFDLVLMDIQMPVMNGEEATAAIRKTKEGATVPIVAITAYAMAGDQEKYLAAGMDGYISKPIERNELYALIHDLCENYSE